MALLFAPLLFNSFLLFRAFDQLLPISSSHSSITQCGIFEHIPFPFHLEEDNDNGFRLSCLLNATTLFLNIGSLKYQILEFFPDGVLVDFPTTIRKRPSPSSSCSQYLDDFSTFDLRENSYYGVSIQNVLSLCDCDDSSLCKDVDYCDKNNLTLPTCHRNTSTTCCHPLSDYSVWEVGDGFSVFSESCRGFSSWVLPQEDTKSFPKCGVKLEWAIPSNSSQVICATDAVIVNATTVRSGVRCTCMTGFVGDGFAKGLGCLKACNKDGSEAYGRDCYVKRHSKKKMVILAGILALAFVLAALAVVFTLLRRPPQQSSSSNVSYRKTTRKTQLFTYIELEQATKGFNDQQKLIDNGNGAKLYSGVLTSGLQVAVQKFECENEENLMKALSIVEGLSQVSHKNVARLVGCCMDKIYVLFVVYEFYTNGTVEEHLRHGLDWHQRSKIGVETATALAYLQYEVTPPIYHHNLRLGFIFLDEDNSVKLAGFGLLKVEDGICSNSEGSSRRFHSRRSDIHDLGLVLLELISGSRHAAVLPKMRSGKVEEIVDPSLYFHEQSSFQREQIEGVADLATRCLLFGGVGRLGMKDVVRELVEMVKGSQTSVDGNSKRRKGITASALDETFSNSSLLQMISMSPDSIYLPRL